MERKLLLLGILRWQEMHGYQLYEFIERDLAACTDLKKPTAYYILNKMAEEGWIEQEITQEGNRPQRKVYRLTSSGEQAYQRLLRQSLSSYQPASFGGDIGLAFLDSLDHQDGMDLLLQRREALAQALNKAQSVPHHQGSLQLMIEHQIHHLKSEVEWLDALLARRKEKEPK